MPHFFNVLSPTDRMFKLQRNIWSVVVLLLTAWVTAAAAGQTPLECPKRPAVGSVVEDPPSLRSLRGVLQVELRYRHSTGAEGLTHFCYVTPDGKEAPTLRLKPGDLLVLHLKNEETTALRTHRTSTHPHPEEPDCTASPMDMTSTNLHFHGLSIPPTCHQDDVLHTFIQPGDKPYEYRVRIPIDQPPGLYWYHPHIHGMTSPQVLGGASGALIVQGIEQTEPVLAGVSERVFVIRDQELLHPNAVPDPSAPAVRLDAEGDVLSTGTGTGKPAKDLSINFVTIPYPTYTPAVIKVRPGETQLWRVLNASAITYLDLQLLFGQKAQPLLIASVDGVPITTSGPTHPYLQNNERHVLLPPAGRVDLIVRMPPAGANVSLVTQAVNTGPAGENDPWRPLATMAVDPDTPESPRLPDSTAPGVHPSNLKWLGDVPPLRTRKLYFSERPHDPTNANSPTDFFITIDGQEPKIFDPNSRIPDIVVHQGEVEDWIVENRTQELHAFHIHQIHFLLLDRNGRPTSEPFLRDTVNVDYWDGKSKRYPRVLLRMDFRDPNIVGTFAYHCHLLEHEDGGMMGTIRVEPRSSDKEAHP